jgi:hypothetical protein
MSSAHHPPPNPHHPPAGTPSATSTAMQPQDFRKRIKELEEENCQLALRLSRAGRHVNRLRLERKLLLERLEQLESNAAVSAENPNMATPEKQE